MSGKSPGKSWFKQVKRALKKDLTKGNEPNNNVSVNKSGHVTLHSDIVSESISAAPITKQSNSTTKFSGDNNGGFQLGANNGTIRDIVFSNKADDNCLKDLRLTDPRDDRKRITVTKGGLLEGSSKWILDHPDFRRWRDDDQSQLLWIKGDPGKGKTMLLIGIIDELERQAVQPRLAGQSTFHATVLTYFFCQGTDSNLNNATAVLRGLIFLLAIQQPLLASHLRKEYEHSGNKLFEGGNTFFALSRVLSGMLQDPTLERTYIIIDALDECETGLQQLLNLFVENTSASRVKWIVSSRNSPEVELELHDSHIKLSLEFKANAEHVSRAVGVYIDEKVLQLKSIRDNDVRQQVKNILRQKAGGTFLWAALVIKELEQAKPWDVLPVLEEVPTGLEELYARMVEKIQQLKRDNPVYCRLMLSAAILANRPLHLLELAVLSRLPKDISSNSETVREFLIMCGSFLIIQDDRVYIIHQSAKNYLSDKATAIIFPSGRPEAHHNMFLRSMQAMSVTLKRDVYGLRHPGFSIDDLRIPVPDPLASIRYSCIHWVDHLIKYCHGNNAIEELQESGLIARFFCQDYLHWLEALSLSRSLFEGIASLLKLESFLKTRIENSYLVSRVNDAYRFILHFRTGIENYPLQSYNSALVFSPTSSMTRIEFEREMPLWLARKPIMEGNWNACLQTLEGHTSMVNSVTFSHDSQLLASASYDKTVKIWDASSGQCLQTLKGHTNMVNSVTFSHDSQLLASASWDKTVKIWDASSGQCLQTLEGHTNLVNSVTFSHDSQLLASASTDETVKVWDASSGQCLQTLEGHISAVNSVTFSHDSQLHASASWDETVKIWDASSGQCLQTLEGHTGAVNSVTFSHDSQLLASASWDRTVKVWDASSGQCLQTLEGHTSNVNSVTFSHDSQLLASASDDETVKVWDASSGQCLQTLEGHTSNVNSVTFSHDSQLLASASDDETVKVWDASSGQCLQTLEGHTSNVNSVTFSHDSQLLASASWDKTVKVWDASSGKCLQTLEGHTSNVNSVTFSHDSQLLASASYDKTVKVWDASSGQCLQTLEGHTSIVNSVLFSHDSQLLASASGDETVKVWDASSGQCLQTIVFNQVATIKSFDTHTGSIELDIGTTRLSSDSNSTPTIPNPQYPQFQGLGINSDRTWITWNSENLLWLPPEYRPVAYTVSLSKVTFGCSSGRVLFFNFNANIPSYFCAGS